MFEAPGHDDEFALLDPHLAVAELEQQPAFPHETPLVFAVVVVPHELAFDLDDLDVGVVELADDLRASMLVELPEFLREVHATHARRPPDGPGPSFPSGRPPVRLSVGSCGTTGSTRPRRRSAPSRRMCAPSPAPRG